MVSIMAFGEPKDEGRRFLRVWRMGHSYARGDRWPQSPRSGGLAFLQTQFPQQFRLAGKTHKL